MSTIKVERDEMSALLKKTETAEGTLNTALAGFSSSADGGIASDKIALIVRIALESAQMASNAAHGVCEVSRQAIESQFLTEEEIMESLDNFTDEAFAK
ncbi:hypothetical protein GCM10022198_16160 [Klugiella xanthotipulae]|uniref:Uncharacterized protein n=1 Tax=Klugiella xanthotipulae TaxID=244735 RepID=A0A543HH40_9MICO|nr:hypothetical protein [Klugiella xanthotipulae]TQM57654.1 hypothetical protein FB466_2649 [Klugiella xanthotipulae]